MKRSLLALFLTIPLFVFAQGQGQSGKPPDTPGNGSDKPSGVSPQEPPMLGLHWERGFAGNGRGGNPASPNMTYHGGKILQTAVSKAIFWGTSWAENDEKVTGLDSWYQGFGGSNYAKTTAEYTDANGNHVGNAVSHQGHVIDNSVASGGSSVSAILAEVCKVVSSSVDPNGNGYYPVYSDVKRGNAGYCAYHSYGTCGGKPVQFAFFFNLDGDAGCDPQDTSGLHSQGLAALSNVSGHELSEAMSDPASPGAWYDNKGEENADKCAWTFNVPLVNFTNGTQWKIQGEWSNAAYNAGTGYANRSGQKGCIAGQ